MSKPGSLRKEPQSQIPDTPNLQGATTSVVEPQVRGRKCLREQIHLHTHTGSMGCVSIVVQHALIHFPSALGMTSQHTSHGGHLKCGGKVGGGGAGDLNETHLPLESVDTIFFFFIRISRYDYLHL